MKSYNGMKVGDIITTYYKGYWKLTKIEKRTRAANNTDVPLFYFLRVLNADGIKVKGQTNACCDAGYCQKVTPERLQEEESLEVGKVKSKFSRINLFLMYGETKP